MRTRTSAIVAALLFAFAGIAIAQVATTGTITVVIADKDGGRLPGVTVTAEAPDTITKRTAVTDATGTAVLEALAPSSQYRRHRGLQGFADLTREQIRVISGQTVAPQPHAAGCGSHRSRAGHRRQRRWWTSRARPRARTSRCELTESLPTGRSYQSYLQLVPGVMPDDQQQSGNPAARSGLNYSDIGGNVGISADNVYYFDGINVTDRGHRHLRREPQHRDHPGTARHHRRHPGGVRRRAGPDLERRHQVGQQHLPRLGQLLLPERQPGGREQERQRRNFSTKDSAFTFGGPVYRDKAWFFGSYRYLNRMDDVSTLDTNEFMRTVDNTQHQGFAKGSWAVDQRRPASAPPT